MPEMNPAAVAALKPYYVRDATEHKDLIGRYATFEEALVERSRLTRLGDGHTYLAKDRRK